MTVEQLRNCLGMVIPVYFEPAVDEATIRGVLEASLCQLGFYCRPENALLVVDRDTAAHRVLRNASSGSPLFGLPVETLARNQGKAGAVRSGLRRLLEERDTPILASRDCDGDGALEDLLHLAGLLREMADKGRAAAVFGVRASLVRPMNWEREQWEQLTNQTAEAIVDFCLAGRQQVQDRTFWNGHPLDLQGGFRVYSRAGAELAVAALERLPDDPDVYLMANEIVPYFEIYLNGGRVGQLQRKTVVEPPISSFSLLPFARCYGSLFRFVARERDIPLSAVRQMLDNAMVDLPGYFSPLRKQFLECRALLDPDAPPPRLPSLI